MIPDSNGFKSLTPTESLMLLYPNAASCKEMIKYSLIELVHDNVLEVYKDFAGVKEKPHMKYVYIRKGRNFESRKIKSYHQMFIAPFLNKNKRRPLHLFVRSLFKSVRDLIDYKNTVVYESMVQDGFFHHTFLKSMYIYTRTTTGKKSLNELKAVLPVFQEKVDSKNVRPSDMEHIWNTLGLNILLLENIDYTSLKNIPSALSDLGKSTLTGTDSLVFMDFNYINYMDTAMDSFDFGGGEFGGGGDGGDWD